MTFRYIGSKSRVLEDLRKHIGQPNGGYFVDAFCGTGAVAELAASMGWPVRINDHMESSALMAAARLISSSEAKFAALGGYAKAIESLNALQPIRGFIWKEYSPASATFLETIERRYFTEENAKKIDAARSCIRAWRDAGKISLVEERLLIADLLGAVNRVANIAGTYGCFLSKWTPQSQETLALRTRELKSSSARVEISVGDVSSVKVEASDVAYLDPPYTKRQYASYYHILETVAHGDEPLVEGVAGLRPWRDRSSDFCYKSKALKALTALIRKMPSQRILLSYSNEGHVPIDNLRNALQGIGDVSTHELARIGRYRPNKTASQANSSVKEYLIVIDRYSEPVLIQDERICA